MDYGSSGMRMERVEKQLSRMGNSLQQNVGMRMGMRRIVPVGYTRNNLTVFELGAVTRG